MKIELNKVYEFDMGDMSHCGKSHEDVVNFYKSNSSPTSFWIEQMMLPTWFDNLVYDTTRVNIDGVLIVPDLRCEDLTPNILDQKAFNAKGGDFNWSRGKGTGRTAKEAGWETWCNSQGFIWTDFLYLPKVTVIALTGEECLRRWPNGKIKRTQREGLFWTQ